MGNRLNGSVMAGYSPDNDVDGKSATQATDERIRREALRQLDSFDIEDDNARMEPLPSFGDEGGEIDEDRDSVLFDHGH